MGGVFSETKKLHSQGKDLWMDLVADFFRSRTRARKELSWLTVLRTQKEFRELNSRLIDHRIQELKELNSRLMVLTTQQLEELNSGMDQRTQELEELNSRLMVLVTTVHQWKGRVGHIQTRQDDHVNGEARLEQQIPPADEVKAEVCLLENQIPPADEVKAEVFLLEKQIPQGDKVKAEAPLFETQIPPSDKVKGEAPVVARVTISCPQKGDFAGMLVLLPHSFEKLLELGKNKYGLLQAKVLTTNGAEIDCVDVIRDGDHLVFATSGSFKVAASNCQCSIL